MQVARSVRKRWAAAAAQYAQAVALASDWGFLSNLAALLLGADDEAGYRAACHELLEKHGSTDNAIQSFSMATVCLLGENSVDDAEKVLILAKRGPPKATRAIPCLPQRGASSSIAPASARRRLQR